MIKRVFDKYGIPIFLDEKREIMNNPMVEMILAVLELPGGGYRYEEVFRYLKTGFAGLTWEQCDTLENYALAYGIKGRDWKAGFTRGEEGDLPELNRLREMVFKPQEFGGRAGEGNKTVGKSAREH